MNHPDAISLAFQVAISCVTLTCEHLKGNRWPRVWLLSLAAQVLWFSWIVYAGNWGLLPLTLALTFVYVRNAFKWRRPIADPAECCAEEGAWPTQNDCVDWARMAARVAPHAERPVGQPGEMFSWNQERASQEFRKAHPNWPIVD